ncbi:hypothetical protein DL96DRAFT_495088 [Flagelloscypha sp. PMI_526]|nr:hypothetical protein DL96DRAFT_495088 [Flagelloscypha sp. PMI_526]
METSFSWSDTLRACLGPCFPASSGTPPSLSRDEENPHRALTQNADLDRLLASDSETDALSLHTNPGDRNNRRKRRRKRRGDITLFGYYLFGKATPPVELGGEDDALHRRRTNSTTTFDSDAPLLRPDELDAEEIAARAQQAEDEQKERKMMKRAQRKEMKRVAAALAASNGSGEFEGFQGSGDGPGISHQKIPSPFMRAESNYSGGSGSVVSSPTTTSHPHLRLPTQQQPQIPHDDDDEADLDGALYSRPTRRRGGPNGSRGSGSDSQSQSRGSAPKSPLSQTYQQPHPQPPMLPIPTPQKKDKKRKSKSKSSKSSAASGSTASSSELPRSPSGVLSPHVEEFDGTPGGFGGPGVQEFDGTPGFGAEEFDGTPGGGFGSGFSIGELKEMNGFAAPEEQEGFDAKSPTGMPSPGLMGGSMTRGRRVSDAFLTSGGF